MPTFARIRPSACEVGEDLSRTLKQRVAARRRQTGASPVQIICTLGPASTERHVLPQLDGVGVDFFRSVSHRKVEG